MNWTPFIPGYISLLLAAACMVAVAAHLLVVERRTKDELRRRIRLANGWVMLIGIPLIAAGFSFINPDEKPRMFLIVWLSIFGLVLISISLAFADMVNTAVTTRRAVLRLRDARRAMHSSLDAAIRADQSERRNAE
jgi:hypothetical protein